MQRLLAAAVTTLVLALAAPATSHAEVLNFTSPLDFTRFVPCANGGAGELVHVTGTLVWRISTSTDGSGGLHSTTHIRPTGVDAVGLTSGAKYQFISQSRDVFNQQGDSIGSVLMSVNISRLIGAGPGNNSWEHNLVHVTVNANGTVTANFFPVNTQCK
jgi:hypothetical protein